MEGTFKSKDDVARYYIEERGMDPESFMSAMESLFEQLRKYLGGNLEQVRELPEQKMRLNYNIVDRSDDDAKDGDS